MTELRLNSKPRALHLINLWLPQAGGWGGRGEGAGKGPALFCTTVTWSHEERSHGLTLSVLRNTLAQFVRPHLIIYANTRILLAKRIQVEYHLRRWKMWMILESRLAHKGILSSARKARQALKILTKFALCANYSIRESACFRARMNMRDFRGGPVAKTLCFQCRGPRVQSLVRKLDVTCHTKDPACHIED